MPRTLIYDIETTPLVTYTWGTYQQDAIKVVEEWYVLCFAYKWLGEKKTHVISLPDFDLYKTEPKNDYEVIKKLHELFEEADITIAHNGDKFDVKKSNARFLYHGFSPPAPHKQIDTLKIARKHFALTSNRLDALGDHLKLGRKVQTGGFDLWLGCMVGDRKAWAKMAKYNRQDVDLLEKVYIKLRPWVTNHPSLGIMDGRPKACDNCGSPRLHNHTKKSYAKRGWRMQYKCYDCGAYKLGTKLHKLGDGLV